MEKVNRISGVACPLQAENIDTDQILPARFLKLARDGSHNAALFRDLMFDANNNEIPDFPLNRPEWRSANIIVAARGFGVGSSRESAVYALYDHGIRCVISPSFGDIFSQNSAKNGLLTAVVSEADCAELMAAANRSPAMPMTIDLETQTIVCGNLSVDFTIDAPRRTRLLNGWDDIDMTNSYRAQIDKFKSDDSKERPWVAPAQAKA